jgi:membrane-associated phospholipid phosphatase
MTWKSFLELDDRVSHRIRLTPENQGWWRLVTVLAHSGDSWFLLAGMAVLWLLGNTAWRGRAVVFGLGIVVLACLVLAIKFTVRRQRPAGEWGAIYRNTDPHSFPSGHAARVIMLAVIGLGLGPLWFGLLLIVWAPLVSLARVMTGLHYLSDILAGMFLGLLAGLVMLAVHPLLVAFVPFLF